MTKIGVKKRIDKNRLQNSGSGTQFLENTYRVHVYLNEFRIIVDWVHDFSPHGCHVAAANASVDENGSTIFFFFFFFKSPNKLLKTVVVFQLFLL